MENLDLFTPVEEGLPKEYGYYLTNAREFSIEYDPLTGWEEEDSFGCIEDITSEVTHWLDLSKLTTKEKAVKFAYDCLIYQIGSDNFEKYEEEFEKDAKESL